MFTHHDSNAHMTKAYSDSDRESNQTKTKVYASVSFVFKIEISRGLSSGSFLGCARGVNANMFYSD